MEGETFPLWRPASSRVRTRSPGWAGRRQPGGCRVEVRASWELAGETWVGWGRGLEAGLGENQPVPSPSLAACSRAVLLGWGPSSLSTSAPSCSPSTPPALQDPAPNPTCLLWDFWSGSLVCRDLPGPGPRPSGVRAQLAVQGDLGVRGWPSLSPSSTPARDCGEKGSGWEGAAEGPAAPGRLHLVGGGNRFGQRQRVWEEVRGWGGGGSAGEGVRT